MSQEARVLHGKSWAALVSGNKEAVYEEKETLVPCYNRETEKGVENATSGGQVDARLTQAQNAETLKKKQSLKHSQSIRNNHCSSSLHDNVAKTVEKPGKQSVRSRGSMKKAPSTGAWKAKTGNLERMKESRMDTLVDKESNTCPDVHVVNRPNIDTAAVEGFERLELDNSKEEVSEPVAALDWKECAALNESDVVKNKLSILCGTELNLLPYACARPRGIRNPGNICFANAVIQALLGCPHFASFLMMLSSSIECLETYNVPTLHALAKLATEITFCSSDADNETARGMCLNPSSHHSPITPDVVINIVKVAFKTRYKNDESLKFVEQEDSHEFLHCLLDSIGEDLLRLQIELKENPGIRHSENDTGNDGWLTQNGKRAVKKQVVGVEMTKPPSLIGAIFEGMQATSIACPRFPRSVTLHPFLVVEIPLYHQSVWTIEQALDFVTSSEEISGYRPHGKDFTCDASKCERFQSLPPVLILHFMRFQFSGSSEKINKRVKFPKVLKFRSSWLTPDCTRRHAEYELVSTISHHGKSITSGHFTANVRQSKGDWLHFDDDKILGLDGERGVLQDVPYMLMYTRKSNFKN